MNTLLELTLRGSVAAGVVWLLDRLLTRRMAARGRRFWWILVPIAFLVSIPIPVLSPAVAPASPEQKTAVVIPEMPASLTGTIHPPVPLAAVCFALWIAGALIYLLAVTLQTRSAVRRWSRLRLSTDSALLELLEDCKAQAGVTAPIGMIVTEGLPAPALMGWLRPRILLPKKTVASLSRPQLRAVLLHELAHFGSFDVPLNWLFTLMRAIHWFNPAAHLIARAWAGFREEAADETALHILKESSGGSYGEALLAALRCAPDETTPFGALTIGESIHHLKRRLTMIHHHHPNQSSRPLAAILVLILLGFGVILRPIHAAEADSKQAAIAAMQGWLGEMDHGQYGQSWTDAAPAFQQAVASQKWVDLSTAVRTPLGKCTSRVLASALEQTAVPSPSGVQKGDFVVAQFDTSFENLKYAVETVTFEKAPDGSWKAAGYYIKPKS